MTRLIPPIAVPFGALRIVGALLGRGAAGEAEFAAALARRAGARGAALFGSGRAALASALASAKSPGRDEALIPAYTCWTVPAAAVRSGLRVRLVDVDPTTLDYDRSDLEAAPTSRVAAVLAAHLFARTSDVAGIVGFFREADAGVRVIEDAAQAWPDRTPESLHAVVLSFGRGKPLPLGGGGALLTFAGDPAPAPDVRRGGWSKALQFLATAALGRPSFFGLMAPLPFLGIGATVYDPDFPAEDPFRAWQDRLGVRVLEDGDELRAARTRNAAALARRVEATPGWRLTGAARASGPLRLAILAPSRSARETVIERLRRLGVAASRMYPGSLADIQALRPHLANPDHPLPGARTLADRLLTLPCHPGLASRDLARIIEAFDRAAKDV